MSKVITKGRVRTPTVLQMEAVECGAASLSIILSYHKLFIPLEELRVECGVSRDGSKAVNIRKAAVNKYGMEAKAFKLSAEKLYEEQKPCIVWWNQNHFLVLEGIKKGWCYLNDPATGPRKCSFEDFKRSYSRVAVFLKPGENFKPGGQKPTLLPRLIPRLKNYKPSVVFFIFSALFLVIPGLAVPAFTRVFIDEILVAKRTEWLPPLLLGMGGAALLTMLLTWIQEYYLLKYQTTLNLAESSKFFAHVMRLPTAFFMQRFGGEVGSRVQLNDAISEVVAEKLSQMVVDLLKTAFFGLLMFFYSWWLALGTILLSMINFVSLRMVARLRTDNSRRLQQDEGKLTGTAMGGLQMMETIKGGGEEDEFFSRWAGYQAKTLGSKQTLGFASNTTGVIPVFVNAITTIVILGLGGFEVMNGSLTIGMLVAFQSIAGNFTKPFGDIVNFAGQIQELQGEMTRIDDVLEHKQDPIYGDRVINPRLKDKIKLSGHVEIENLKFGYNVLGPPLIDDFSLEIRPGQRVALVGGSGSGKSTVAKIVAGLYQPWSGAIKFDGVPRDEIDNDLINNSIAVIDQEPFLFEGSIRDNLSMWDATILERRIIEALRDAAFLEKISARPGGLSSHIDEGGSNFSGGERQRLEIARSLVGEPKFLILDEATSALDPPTEKEIEKSMLRRGCSCLVVAHRLSTIRDSDEIIVMDNGKIAERGTHEKLLEMGGIYADLVKE